MNFEYTRYSASVSRSVTRGRCNTTPTLNRFARRLQKKYLFNIFHLTFLHLFCWVYDYFQFCVFFLILFTSPVKNITT